MQSYRVEIDTKYFDEVKVNPIKSYERLCIGYFPKTCKVRRYTFLPVLYIAQVKEKIENCLELL